MEDDKLRLLVVEDDDEDFLLLQDMLARDAKALTLEHASTLAEALQRSASHSFDLFLLDYRLGADSGLELMRRLKAQGVAAPMIFLTGQGDEDTAVEAMKLGATDYLIKSKLTAPALRRAIGYARSLHEKEQTIRQAQRDIEASERRFRALVENSSDAITLQDAAGRVFYCSPSCRRVLGYAPEELVGTLKGNLLHPDDRDLVQHAHRQAMARHGLPVRIEYRFLQKDGSWRWLEATGVNRLDDPDVRAFVVNHRDISEQRQAREELRAALEAMHCVFRASPLALVEFDRERRIVRANPATETIFGWRMEELAGAPIPDPESRAVADAALDAVLRGETMAGRESRARTKSGREIVIQTWMAPVRDASGQICGAIDVVADMTRHKQTEEALRESERQYRDLFENANDAILIFDPEGEEILEANSRACELYGYAREDLIGRSLKTMTQDVARGEEQIRQTLRSGAYRNFETVHHKRTGEEMPMLVNSSVIEYRGRKAILSLNRDMSELRQIQQQLAQAQKMDAVGQLAGGIAHDFNNLLMIISSYSELFAAGVEDRPELRKQAEEVQKAARKAAALTRQLLAFSRKQVLSPRLMDLNQAINDTGRLLPRLIGENIEIRVVPGEHLWPVTADPVQIDQVLMNLAVNARDAMPTGGELTLETSNVVLDREYARVHATVGAGEYVLLAVSDTGTGIAPDVLPHIFEPFFTTKGVGQGTGLGLPTVYGIVKQSGGSVWVYSEVGKGTTFKVYLPRAAQVSATVEKASEAASSSQGSETLLLVEDEDALRQVTGDYLRARGYTVVEAQGGAEALEEAGRFAGEIHVLLTDVVMPGMSGRELAEELVKLRPATKVLYISGYTEATVARHGVQPGALFLQKPFALAELAAKVRELLNSAVPAAA